MDFDRLTFEFRFGRPGHRVRYVQQLIQDGSGNPVPLRGRAVVEIVLQPAIAHEEGGGPTVPNPPTVRDFAAFRQVADAGDFEGVLTRGIGVAARTALTIVTLSGPPRIAVDVKHTPPGTGSQLLRRGDSSAAVATWQWRLVQATGVNLRVDEDFGPLTETATHTFQGAQGIGADGIVGPVSRARMETALGI